MSSLHILELPSEVLSLILLQVPCADLVTNVGLVCRHFHALLRSAWYWRTRFVDLTSSQLPNVPLDSSQWKLGCLQYESMAAEQKMHSLTGERLCPCVCVCASSEVTVCVCVPGFRFCGESRLRPHAPPISPRHGGSDCSGLTRLHRLPVEAEEQ